LTSIPLAIQTRPTGSTLLTGFARHEEYGIDVLPISTVSSRIVFLRC